MPCRGFISKQSQANLATDLHLIHLLVIQVEKAGSGDSPPVCQVVTELCMREPNVPTTNHDSPLFPKFTANHFGFLLTTTASYRLT